MRCLRCDAAQELVIALDLRGVPHHSAGHHTVYDWDVVLSCPSCGYGELRTFSHDCWAQPWDEEWDMEWSAQLPPDTLAVLRQAVATCADPSVTTCECPAHTSLRATTTIPNNLRIDTAPKTELATGRPDAQVTLTENGVPAFVRVR